MSSHKVKISKEKRASYEVRYEGRIGKKDEEHVYSINGDLDRIYLGDFALKGSPEELVELGMMMAFAWIAKGE